MECLGWWTPRLRAHFNLLVLGHMSLINVLIRPDKARSYSSHLSPAIHFSYVEYSRFSYCFHAQVFKYFKITGNIHLSLYPNCGKWSRKAPTNFYDWHLYFHFPSSLSPSLTLFSFNTQSALEKRPNGSGLSTWAQKSGPIYQATGPFFSRVASFGPLT